MNEKSIESFYQRKGMEVVDCLYDKGYFREDVSRRDMQEVENLIAFFFQIQCESAVKCSQLVKRIKGGVNE